RLQEKAGPMGPSQAEGSPAGQAPGDLLRSSPTLRNRVFPGSDHHRRREVHPLQQPPSTGVLGTAWSESSGHSEARALPAKALALFLVRHAWSTASGV